MTRHTHTIPLGLMTALGALGLVAANGEQAFADLTDGLVGYWSFDNEADPAHDDSPGGAHNGTVYGATWTSAGKFAGALSFDGVNDYVGFSSPVRNTPPYSVCAWVKINSPSTSKPVFPLANGGETSQSYGLCLYKNTYPTWGFGVRTADGWATDGGTEYSPATTQWTFLCGTWDGSMAANSIKFYVNGDFVSSDTPVPALAGPALALRIGGPSEGDPGYYFPGRIDEVRIYDRALGPDEVWQLYSGEPANQPPVADAGGPYGGMAGEEITFDASGSYDLDGTVVGYRWDWTGDGTWDTDWLTEMTAVHTYVGGFHGQVRLQVRDDGDATDTDAAQVDVSLPPDGLVAYWSFDEGDGEVAHDDSGHGYDGAIYGASWVEGVSGNALYFHGCTSGDRVAFDSPVWNTPPYTVCAWVKLDATQTTGHTSVIQNGGGGSVTSGFSITKFTWSQWNFLAKDEAGYQGHALYSPATTDWAFLCGTWDGSTDPDSVKFYVDGQLADSATPQATAGGPPLNLRIGGPDNDTSPYHFYGIIDEVRIYNRVLPSDEVGLLYAAQAPPDHKLIAYWCLDEGAGSTAHDCSAHDNHGTIDGAAWTTGVSGSALEIVDTDIVRSIPASFDNSVSTALSIAGWVYWYGDHPWTYAKDSYIFDARTDTSSGFFFRINEGGLLMFLLQQPGPNQHVSSECPVPINQWTHVASVFDYASQTLRVFINGLEDGAASAIAPYYDGSHSPAIGNNHWAPGDGQWAPLNGIVDELRIYNRALSSVELQGLYAADSPPRLYVSSLNTDCVLEYDGSTGAFLRVFTSAADLGWPTYLTLGPNGNLFVLDWTHKEVKEYDRDTGAFLGVFASGGGLDYPEGIAFGPNGNLFVGDWSQHRVLEYDGTSGAYLRAITDGSLSGPHGVCFAPNGNLLVSSSNNDCVIEYQFSDAVWAYVRTISGGLDSPLGLTFGPNGNLFVVSNVTDTVVQYAWPSGSLLGTFASGGGLDGPYDLVFGPNGNLFVTSYDNDSVLEYDGTNGAFVGTVVQPGSGGLDKPVGLVFKPAGNQPPVADADGPYGGMLGEEITFDACGSYDPDGSVVSYRWDWTNDGAWDTDWLSECTATHVYDAEFHGQALLQVRDNGCAKGTDTADVDVYANQPPVCDAGEPPPVECAGATTAVELDGTGSFDPDPDDTLTFAWTTDCPGGTFDDATSATPVLTVDSLAPCPLVCSVTLTVTDDDGASDMCSTTVTITDTTTPSVTCPEAMTVECDGAGNAAQLDGWLSGASAGDTCGGVSLSDDYAGLSDDCGETGSATVTWTATDDCDLTNMCLASFTIEDTTPPTIDVCPPETTVECDGAGNVDELNAWLDSFQASDVCGDVTLTDDFTGLSDECGETGSATVTFTATDDCGNVAWCSATFAIEDTTLPVITCPPNVALESESLDCDVTYSGPAAVGTDDCDMDPAVTSDPSLPATFDEIGDHTITFTAMDACANFSACTMTVTVLPTSYCLKREAIDALEDLLSQDPGDDDLIQAIGYLHMSLGEDNLRAGMSGSEVLWGDPKHVDECHGGYKGADAFQYEQEACDKLDAYIDNDENAVFGFGPAIEAVRQMLAEADEILAATAIADAIAADGDPGDIADAQALKAEGDAARAAGGGEICDVALDKYEEAWEKAVGSWCG